MEFMLQDKDELNLFLNFMADYLLREVFEALTHLLSYSVNFELFTDDESLEIEKQGNSFSLYHEKITIYSRDNRKYKVNVKDEKLTKNIKKYYLNEEIPCTS